MVNYVLFETASGYALFERLQFEEIGAKLAQVQDTVTDLAKFGKYQTQVILAFQKCC
ncbi:unnamed protein product [Absidia cylindrospora]